MPSQHTAEFRQEAVRVALTSGLNRKQVTSDFGVGFSTLSRWIQLERQTLPEPTAQSELEAEVTRLRKENRLLREEREVLKKATIHRPTGECAAITERDLRGSKAMRFPLSRMQACAIVQRVR